MIPGIKMLATGQMLLNDSLSVFDDDTVDGNDVLGKEFDEEPDFQFKSRNVWDD